MTKFILASGSPRRSEILKNIGLDFKVCISNAEETFDPALPPYLIVEELSLLKATSVAKQFVLPKIIIAADTIVVSEGKILGKPGDESEAKAMLMQLSGHSHEVYTGISIVASDTLKSVSDYEVTRVNFRTLTEEMIDEYIATGEPMDKAGAYGIQERGSLFITGINGDYFNVMGLPICKLGMLLKKEFEIEI